jgi:PD-(D/E)XK nuclease superfamily
MKINDLTYAIIGAAMKVHRTLGPGLLESAYEACLAYELEKQGLRVQRQKPVPVIYAESNWSAVFARTFWSRSRSTLNARPRRPFIPSTALRFYPISGF